MIEYPQHFCGEIRKMYYVYTPGAKVYVFNISLGTFKESIMTMSYSKFKASAFNYNFPDFHLKLSN